MGDDWDSCITRLKEEVKSYGEKTQTDFGTIVREMWEGAASTSIWGPVGDVFEIHCPEILLLALCQLARDQEFRFWSTAQDFSQICEASMRIVWIKTKASCSSHQSELVGSQSGESSNPMSYLPSWITQSEKSEVRSLLWSVTQTRHVSEAFSAVEKVWRSILNEETVFRRFQGYTGAIVAAAGWPLAKGETMSRTRVGLLRGAGNAICPQTAARFIISVMEAVE